MSSYILKPMKKIITILLLSLTSSAYALPDCPSDVNAEWHNCFGTFTYPDGAKYVGGYKDNKRHGQGTYTWADGTTQTGIWEDGESAKTYIGTGAEPNTNGSSATENNLPVLSVLFVLIFVFLVLLYITVTKRRAGAHGTESREQPTEKLRAWTSLISILLMVGLPLGTLGITGYNTMTLPRENPSLLDLAGWNLYSNLEWVAMGIFSLISIYVGWSIRTQRDASATHRNILFIWGLCVAAPLTMDSVIPALALGLPLHELIFDPGNLGHLFGLAIFAAFCQRYLSRSMNLASGHQRAVGISSEGGAAWELEKFAELKEKGIISEEEFNKKKEQLLK